MYVCVCFSVVCICCRNRISMVFLLHQQTHSLLICFDTFNYGVSGPLPTEVMISLLIFLIFLLFWQNSIVHTHTMCTLKFTQSFPKSRMKDCRSHSPFIFTFFFDFCEKQVRDVLVLHA